MESIWFVILAAMLTAYVVLDGFDFGAGILHLFVAKTDDERRTIFAAIGPVWDGNEVWLVASGGMLIFAFPRAYAAACSGFYLLLMMVLWLLVFRGIGIEFRSREPNALWRAFWDAVFAFASTLMALVLGVSLGNVVRGFPIDAAGTFLIPLFTDFDVGPHPGALDWYTVLVGAFAVVALGAHGALYLAWKTEGTVHARSARFSRRLYASVALIAVPLTAATSRVNPSLFANVFGRSLAWPLIVVFAGAVVALVDSMRRAAPLRAFLASCAFLASLLGLTAAGLYPTLLRSTLDPSSSLTIDNAAAGRESLVTGLFWWTPAIALAIGYFIVIFRLFRGKVSSGDYGH
jgi:cytochrome bd ubiquinol oxidase subunit II